MELLKRFFFIAAVCAVKANALQGCTQNYHTIYCNNPTHSDIINSETNFTLPYYEIHIHNSEKLTHIDDTLFVNGSYKNIEVLKFTNNTFNSIQAGLIAKFPYLKSINFSSNKFSSIKEGVFNYSLYTSSVDLSNNSLRTIPSFDNFFALASLNLASNPLRKIEGTFFTNCQEPLNLDLSNAEINFIHPDAFDGVEINQLNLKGNEFKVISNITFSKLTKLHTLNLSSNKLTKIVNNTFANIRFLINLDLSNNSISKIEKDAFYGLGHLQRLDLSHNPLGTLDLSTFGPLFIVKSLNLQSANLSSLDYAFLDMQVEEIYLNYNHFKCDALVKILDVLAKQEVNVADAGLVWTKPNVNGITCVE